MARIEILPGQLPGASLTYHLPPERLNTDQTAAIVLVCNLEDTQGWHCRDQRAGRCLPSRHIAGTKPTRWTLDGSAVDGSNFERRTSVRRCSLPVGRLPRSLPCA